MSITFEMMMAVRYLRAKNMKFCSTMTLFSIIGVMLGVATLIVVMSVMNGFRAKLLDSVFGINGHINVYCDKNTDYRKILESIKKIPGISKAIPITNDQVIIEADGNITSAIVRGITIDDLLSSPVIGNNVVVENMQEEGVIMGARLLNTDYVTLISPKGFDVLLGEMPEMKQYKVIGTFNVGMPEYDSALIYMPLKAAQSFFHYKDSVHSIEVFVDDVKI